MVVGLLYILNYNDQGGVGRQLWVVSSVVKYIRWYGYLL